MQIEKLLVKRAEELKLATLRAKEQGITGYEEVENYFKIFNDEDFKKIAKDRKYTISHKGNYRGFMYEYKVKIDGLEFKNITNKLLLEGDEDKLGNGEIGWKIP